MTYSDDIFRIRRPRYDALRAEAKKLRSQARRLEAKGDRESAVKAAILRNKIDGINLELDDMRK